MNKPVWIPVTKDTLPAIGEWVLIWNNTKGVPLIGKLACKKWMDWALTWEWQGEWEYVFLHNQEPRPVITHWCKVEIPPPPQKE